MVKKDKKLTLEGSFKKMKEKKKDTTAVNLLNRVSTKISMIALSVFFFMLNTVDTALADTQGDIESAIKGTGSTNFSNLSSFFTKIYGEAKIMVYTCMFMALTISFIMVFVLAPFPKWRQFAVGAVVFVIGMIVLYSFLPALIGGIAGGSGVK